MIDEDLGATLMVVSGYPSIGELFSYFRPVVLEHEELARRVDELWELLHEGRYAELDLDLRRVITQLETAVRCPYPHDDVRALHGLRDRAYEAADAMLTANGQPEAAWVANDRSLQAALLAGDPLRVAAAHYRLGRALLQAGRLEQADHVAAQAADALGARTVPLDAPPEVTALYGALHLVRATIAARRGKAAGARWCLGVARKYAERLGEDRDDFGTGFGPTDVQLHYVAVTVELGDAREALDIAKKVDTSALSPERHARLLLDVARAHTLRERVDEAIQALIRADELAPELIRAHALTRETTTALLAQAGPRPPAPLLSLHRRTACS